MHPLAFEMWIDPATSMQIYLTNTTPCVLVLCQYSRVERGKVKGLKGISSFCLGRADM